MPNETMRTLNVAHPKQIDRARRRIIIEALVEREIIEGLREGFYADQNDLAWLGHAPTVRSCLIRDLPRAEPGALGDVSEREILAALACLE